MTNSALWNRNFALLVIANTMLYIAVYMLFPLLHHWSMESWGCTELTASAVTAVFAVALFFPGILNAYLVDTFPRKQVCIRSMLLLLLLNFAYVYLSAVWQVFLVRILQGMCFGVTLASTGATLAIDVTPGNKRDQANLCFAWSGVLGMLIGVAVGVWYGTSFSFFTWMCVSALLGGVSVLCISMLDVCFRAPLDLPLFSLDRFLLPRVLLPGINMMIVPFILGALFGAQYQSSFYLCMAGGFLFYLLCRYCFSRLPDGGWEIGTGLILMAVGLALLQEAEGYQPYLSGSLIGLGVGFSLSRFLQMMILLPLHCERGTGFHTYQLLWEAGVMFGVLAGRYFFSQGNMYNMALTACAVGLIFYYTCIRVYFRKHMLNR